MQTILRSSAAKRMRKTTGRGKAKMYSPVLWTEGQAMPLKLQIPVNPFPPKFRTKLTYAPASTYWTPATNTAVAQYALNGLFQPEIAGAVFGTGIQPLYFDQLCTSTGPYKQYKVHGWKGVIRLINVSGQYDDTPSTSARDSWEVIFQQGFELAAEGDTNAELQSAPNIQRYILPNGFVGGSKSCLEIPFNGKVRDFVDSTVEDSSMAGAYTGNPSVVVYGNLGVRSLNSKTITGIVQMTLEYDVEFFGFDAVQSA